MWRGNLKNEDERLENFSKDKAKIYQCLKKIKKIKYIKKVYIFPYTQNFLNNSYKNNIFDGAIVYRNPRESKFDKFIMKNKKKNFIIIRPFGGKIKLIKKYGLRKLINYSNKYNNIKKIIFSCSKIKQLEEILKISNAKKIL